MYTQNKFSEGFFKIKDVTSMIGCSERSAQKHFNDPKFSWRDYSKPRREVCNV